MYHFILHKHMHGDKYKLCILYFFLKICRIFQTELVNQLHFHQPFRRFSIISVSLVPPFHW